MSNETPIKDLIKRLDNLTIHVGAWVSSKPPKISSKELLKLFRNKDDK